MITEDMWMWVLGGTCGVVLLLISVIGGFILHSISKISDELKNFRLEFTENKGETITWPKFTNVKRDMEKDRTTEIKLAISEHAQGYVHERKVS